MTKSFKSKKDIIKYVIFILVSIVPLASFSLLPFVSNTIPIFGGISYWKLLGIITETFKLKLRFIFFIPVIAGVGVIVGQVIRDKAVACISSIFGTLFLLAILAVLWYFVGMAAIMSVIKFIGIGFWLTLAGFMVNIANSFLI